ncbi:phage tail tip lysozyme [Mesorhizobium sp. M4B.F.Ca.ET.058.02.1.1]|uniref:phage tail tip lysozyme n=1 Tax=Mesorhizobium sp. M4B.F.Ca.ET.058.02.1.1 TaxID=2493675 RepID=UPI000F74C219|nr:phage tail tip lysozyme [Mesorhizobium sp. M4B.F.Ca.ET.058.02.1.1]AZO51260.1 hypothetical protein EJ073_28695 [Mesorhizobium sp. M4B.F.Ca.ET.058.02.1.1]
MGFIFGPGQQYQTPEELAKARAVAEALLNQQPIAHNIGEGLAVVGQAIRGRRDLNRIIKAQGDMRAGADGVFSALFGAGAPAATSTAAPSGGGAVASALGGGSMGSAPDLSGNDVYNGFMDTVKSKVTNPYGLAAVAATANAESRFSPKNAFGSWSDPSESGQAGTAGGILSWRGPRFEAMRTFAGSNGGDANAPSPQLQAQYFLREDPGLIDSLNAAKSPEEAQRLMNNAWKFAGYNRPGGEAARRISMANSFASRFAGSDAAPVNVASLELGAGVSAALNKRPAPDGPAAVAQPVQSPRAAEPPPVAAKPAAAAQTVAQASPASGGPSVQQLLQASQDPRLSEQQRGVVNLMLKQKLDEANPANQLELEKNRLEVEKLRNPQIEPGDKARLDFDREKFAAEQSKPIEVGGVLVDPKTHEPVYTGQQTDWEKLDERTLYNKRTGETRAVSIGGANAGQFRFTGNSVEAQALNGLMDGGGLTVEQAQQLAAGKTISGPNGELLFLTPQGVFGQASAGGPAMPVTPKAAPAPAPAPEAPAAPESPTPTSPRAANPPPSENAGILPLTGAKQKPLNEQQQRDNKLYSVVAPELQIVEKNFSALSNPSDQALSAIPRGSDFGAEYLKSPEYQRASNSLRTIIASYLYSVSGATAAPAEVENQAAILTPKPGEAKASLDDKLARIRQMVDAIKSGGGSAPAGNAGTGGGTTSNGLKWSIEP